MEAKDILKQHGFTDNQIQALANQGSLEEAAKGFDVQEEPVEVKEEEVVAHVSHKKKKGHS